MESTNPPTDGEVPLYLWPHQIESVCNIDEYPLAFIIGARGSGKSFEDAPRIIRWADMCTELPYGIFATTDTQLQTVLAPIRAVVDAMGIEHRYESQAPAEWRETWDAQGIKYPPQRLRDGKFWIWDTGAHFYTGGIINNAWTRAKSLNFNAILIQEGTEPGITLNAVMSLFGCCRCGSARPGPDGVWRCTEPGHLHQLVLSGNTPLNDPSHWIYHKHDELERRETERKAAGKKPFYKFLAPATKDNPATGEDYDERLRSAYDSRTYIEQTQGGLPRNTALASYHQFSEQNILASLGYDPRRPLHLWADFNATPASFGWGHDLRLDEVPEPMRRKGYVYHGIVGELFSGHEPMLTEQAAYALLEDPSLESPTEGRCMDCTHMMREHRNTGVRGLLCTVCGYQDATTLRHCSGRTTSFTAKHDYIHAPSNWHGLAKHRGPIFIYADATGGATHADASNPGGSIQILRDVFGANLPYEKVHFRIPKSNPAVRMRMLAMNRMLCDAHMIRRLYMAPWVTAHIDDFREVVPDPKTGEPMKIGHRKGRNGACPDERCLRTHATDGAGYHVAFRWPAILRNTSGGIPNDTVTDLGPVGQARLQEPRSRE